MLAVDFSVTQEQESRILGVRMSMEVSVHWDGNDCEGGGQGGQ